MKDATRRWQGIIPPYMLEKMAQSDHPDVKKWALENLALSSAIRAERTVLMNAPGLLASASPTAGKHRLVYDAKHGTTLPGILARSEGEPKVADKSVNQAYDGTGYAYDFYKKIFNRNSIDNNGMSLISTVHYGNHYNNAFWNGRQFVFGDGDGVVFKDFTLAIDVIGHELTHGVEAYTGLTRYDHQTGALMEHFSDVFGVCIREWVLSRRVKVPLPGKPKGPLQLKRDPWLVGDALIEDTPTRKAIRSMKAPGTAYVNDPILGTDPQPANMSHIYTGPGDNYGVHINCGIPNKAFYEAATRIGGKVWEKPANIWWHALLLMNNSSDFQFCANKTLVVATGLFGHGSAEAKAVLEGWKIVGIAAVAV